MKNTIVISWVARILTIAFAVFISIFAMDVFDEGSGFGKTLLALVIHLIPTFIIVLLLLLSWKWEWIGGIAFAILGIVYIVTARKTIDWTGIAVIAVPLFILAALFLLVWYRKTRAQS